MENRQPSQSNISNESEPQAADSTEETPPVAGPEPSRSQAPDQTIKELKTDEAKYPQLEGFKKEDALAQENLAKMKILYDKLIEHLEGEKDKKGERLFPSELVKQLIQKIQYEPALYKGDENDPISCVNYESGNGTIFISPKFFEKTDEGQLYNFAHELSHLIIHKGIIWTDDYNQYFSAYLEAVTKPESAKKIDSTKNPELAYGLKILQNPSLAKGESAYIQHMMANLQDEAKMRKIFENIPAQKGITKDEKYFQEKFLPHYKRQIAEEIMNERLSCFLDSDGSWDGYMDKIEHRIGANNTEDQNSMADFLKTLITQKGEDPSGVDAYIEAQKNPQLAENQQLITDFQTKHKELLDEWTASHKACYEKFKTLKDAEIDEDNSFDNGMPYYESGMSGFAGGKGEGFGIWDWIWGDFVGKPIQI